MEKIDLEQSKKEEPSVSASIIRSVVKQFSRSGETHSRKEAVIDTATRRK